MDSRFAAVGAGALFAVLLMPIACGADRQPPVPINRNWSYCGFPLSVPDEINEGWVLLKVTVNAAGAVVWVEPVASSHPVFEARAKECAVRGRFDPAVDEQGNPVAQELKLKIKFLR